MVLYFIDAMKIVDYDAICQSLKWGIIYSILLNCVDTHPARHTPYSLKSVFILKQMVVSRQNGAIIDYTIHSRKDASNTYLILSSDRDF